MKHALRFTVLFLAAGLSAFAQRPTGEIRGSVLDPTEAGIPKATLSAKDLATNLVYNTTSGADGSYVIPNLVPGTYDITVTADGFQKAVISKVVVETGRTLDLPVRLVVGSTTQVVEVSGTAVALETSSNQIAATIRNDGIKDLPLNGRDTLQFASLTAGYAAGTFNGLFQAALNISLDGTNVNDTRNKSGTGYGFSSQVPLRLDAIEEVSVSTSGLEASNAAGGAMTIQFMTRRGTTEYHGSVYEEWRNDFLNANTFFNNMQGIRKDKVRLNDFGGNFGGPLKIPFVPYFNNKLFFFVNYELSPVPGSANRSVNVMTPEAQSGIYRYMGTDGQLHTVNVLQIAAANGYPSAIDPTVANTMKVINSTLDKGTLLPIANNFYQQSLTWKIQTNRLTTYPTARLDYQITDKVAWHGSWNLGHNHVDPTGSTYPGLPGQAGESKYTNYSLSNAVDTTFSPTLFNSAKFGIQSSVSGSNIGNSVYQWSSQGDKRVTFGSPIPTPFIPNSTPLIRTNPAYTFSDELSWVKGKHTLKFGGSGIYTHFYENDYYSFSGVLNYTLGIDATDPINSIFTAANFPYMSASQLPGTPAQLYATLTGRVRSIQGYENINEKTRQYEKFAPLVYRESYRSWGAFIQDSFRIRPSLTLNYGFRWEFTGVMTNTNNTFMSPKLEDIWAPSKVPFQPGVFDATRIPAIDQRSVTYAPDRVNPAPNFGFAWNPRKVGGFLGRLLGDSKTVVRGSYGITYFDEGLNVDYWVNTNAGNWRSVSAMPGSEFAPGSLTLQSPDPTFLVAPPKFTPPFAETQFAFQNYNIGTTAGKSNGEGKLPTMRNPYVQSWNFGIQREIAPNLSVEARYVGNKTTHKWRLYGVQEINVFENGFLQEFVKAQKNLAINQAAGVNSFQNRGLAGQVPLPIFEAMFGARGSQPALSAGSSWTSTTFINRLTLGNIGALANSLFGGNTPTYYCRLVGNNFGPCADRGYNAPGPYPINFWVPNPYTAESTITNDNSWANYHALQIDVRRRTSGGLTLTGSYTWSKSLSDLSGTNQTLNNYHRTLRDFSLDKQPVSTDRRHSFRLYGTYDLPFGRGRHFSINNGVLDRILGGWTIGGISTLVSGGPSMLTSGEYTFNYYAWGTPDAGVILNGMSLSDLRDKLLTSPRRVASGAALNLADPSLLAADGRANSQYLALPTTPGQFGQFLYIYGPWYFSFDSSINKQIPITERVRFQIQAEVLNTLNHAEFGLGTLNINSTSFGQTSSSMTSPRNVQLRAYLRW
jgi:hypothetical protein